MAIIIKDKHIQDMKSSGESIEQILAKDYESEIADRVAKDDRLKGFDAFNLAMMDAGISKSSVVKDFYATNDNHWLFPVFIDRTLKENVLKNDVLKYIVSGSAVSVPGTVVESAYLELENFDPVKKKRVSEGADLPKAVLKIGDSSIRLYKYGRAIEATYESMRNQSVDLFARHLAYIANDVANQEFEKGLDVLINGDGNNNAAEVNTTAGTAIAANDIINLALDIWDKTHSPLTTIIASRSLFIALNGMVVNTSESSGYLPAAMFNFPQGITKDVTVVYGNVPKSGSAEQLIGLNNDFALTKYIEQGSAITEYDRNILNQTNLGTISETSGFAKNYKYASRLLKVKS